MDELEVRIARLRVEHGETLMLMTDRHITADQASCIREMAARVLPGVPVGILAGGLLPVVVRGDEGGGGSKV